MHFVDNQTGFLIGENGYLAKSTNGGQIWSNLSVGTLADLNALAFRTSDEGLVVGDSGTVLHTDDGGESWQQQTIPTTRDLIQVFYADDSVGYARAGNVFYKNQNNVGLTLEEDEIIRLYPNPTTGILNIFSHDVISKMEMINTSGKVIFSMNDPETTLTLPIFPSGVYYVRFTTKDSIRVKKLVLINE
ncbi:MAG: T9SS type A sorting domain-containing protein [Cryomorphaceae bacterium]|nr:T9SS type A sorting domain-containing protein [Cryomorphaceae bacterium]